MTILSSLLALTTVGLAQPGNAPRETATKPEQIFEGRVLPDSLLPGPEPYLNLGLAFQPFTSDLVTVDFLYGASVMLRSGPWAPQVTLLVDPRTAGYEKSRFLAALGLRSYLSILGAEVSYGVAVHAEVRLADHFWLAMATPLELGVVVLAKNSWDLQLFVGAQHPFAGSLINNFLIDPNGLDNENALDRFDEVRHENPWRGFIRLVFGRRLD